MDYFLNAIKVIYNELQFGSNLHIIISQFSEKKRTC